jgi:hypothetical protein
VQLRVSLSFDHMGNNPDMGVSPFYSSRPISNTRQEENNVKGTTKRNKYKETAQPKIYRTRYPILYSRQHVS